MSSSNIPRSPSVEYMCERTAHAFEQFLCLNYLYFFSAHFRLTACKRQWFLKLNCPILNTILFRLVWIGITSISPLHTTELCKLALIRAIKCLFLVAAKSAWSTEFFRFHLSGSHVLCFHSIINDKHIKGNDHSRPLQTNKASLAYEN